MCDHTFSELANYQLRHLATHKVGCQSGDCIWSLRFSSGVCVGTYGLTYSLYHPRGHKGVRDRRIVASVAEFSV